MTLKSSTTGVEAYPVLEDELSQLNYATLIDADQHPVFEALHQTPWAKITAHKCSFFIKKKTNNFLLK